MGKVSEENQKDALAEFSLFPHDRYKQHQEQGLAGSIWRIRIAVVPPK